MADHTDSTSRFALNCRSRALGIGYQSYNVKCYFFTENNRMHSSVLVGMLCSGERERDEAVAALKGQTFPDWELVSFENLPNKQAHDQLYQMFMEEAGNFSHFLKLDADMVFRRETALQEVLQVFGRVPELDWLMLDVQDWYSNTLMPGLQIFSN